MASDIPAPKLTRKERENDRHRREILDVAVKLFAEKGFHETTMQMVAEDAEFSVGYLYKHFPGKDDMYRELVLFHLTAMDRHLAEIEASGLPPLAYLRATYDAVCEHFNQHRHFMRIYHQRIESSVTELLDRKCAHFDETVKIFTNAISVGELRPQDPRVLAIVMQGAAQELFHEMAEKDVARPFDGLADLLFRLIVDPQRLRQ